MLGALRLTLPGGLMLGVLAAGALMTPPALQDAFREAGPPETLSALVRGDYTESFETLYGDKLAPREWSVELWGAIDYALFRTGRSGVVVGQDGWLFSAEEYRRPEGSAENLAANLAVAAEAARRLEAEGIALTVAVVPAKAEIYADRVGVPVPAHRAETYAAFLDGLAAAGLTVVDLGPAMAAARPEAPVFMSRDTHWSPFGAEAAARAVAGVLAGEVVLEPAEVTRIALPGLDHRGDLTRFTPVGGFRDVLGLGDERVVPFGAEVAAGADALFGDSQIPVVLVGTSYSAQEQWSFAPALSLALEVDVLNLAEEGGGPVGPMRAFLDGLDDMESLPLAVVWEWPARFADTDYRVQP